MQIDSQDLDTASSVLQITKNFLSSCPSDLYIIIQQRALAASDFSTPGAVPHLRAAISDPRVRASYSVADVIYEGGDMVEELAEHIEASCGKNVTRWDQLGLPSTGANAKNIIVSTVDTLPSEKEARVEDMADQDAMLNINFFEHLPNGPEYTVIYTTTPFGILQQDQPELSVYQVEFDATAHIDLKRDFRIRADNSTDKLDTRPLFEKYQYFTPGIFMGLLVGLLLLSILYVGLNAVSSLQVSYGAFEKEMGPAAQKKQQ